MTAGDLLKKYRYVLISELILILVLSVVLFTGKSYSFSLTPEVTAFTPEAALDGYVIPSSEQGHRLNTADAAKSSPQGLRRFLNPAMALQS